MLHSCYVKAICITIFCTTRTHTHTRARAHIIIRKCQSGKTTCGRIECDILIVNATATMCVLRSNRIYEKVTSFLAQIHLYRAFFLFVFLFQPLCKKRKMLKCYASLQLTTHIDLERSSSGHRRSSMGSKSSVFTVFSQSISVSHILSVSFFLLQSNVAHSKCFQCAH